MGVALNVGRIACIVGLATMFVACGGGGGDGGGTPPPVPTPLPATVTITAPAKAQSAGNVAFAPSFTGSSGLTFKWDFGDGSALSAEPAPMHPFAKPGDYQVLLTVTDASGASRNASFDNTVNNQANVRGLVCSAAEDAGWCWSRTVAGNGDLFNDVVFSDAQSGWAAGDAGGLYKTADGGKTWVSKLRLAGEHFQQIAFGNVSTGWALTKSGRLYASTDGGQTWQLQLDRAAELAASYYSLKLVVVDGQRLAVVGSGSLLPTTLSADGGKTWRPTSEYIEAVSKDGVIWGASGRSTDFGLTFVPYAPITFDAVMGEQSSSLTAVDGLVAVRVIVAYYAFSFRYASAVAVTTDGGASWVRRNIAPDGPRLSRFFGTSMNQAPPVFYPASSERMWANTGERLARSVDGGRTWTWLPTTPWRTPGVAYEGLWVLATEADNADALIVRAYEDTPAGIQQVVYRTADGGSTWKRYAPDATVPQTQVADFRRLGPQAFLWRASNGNVLRTDDDGAHWSLLAGSSLPASAIKSLAFFDGKQGLAVQNNGNLLATADGGQTWAVQNAGTGTYDVPASSALQVFADTVWLLRDGNLSTSPDRGKTWADVKPAPNGDRPVAMNFFDARRGVVATLGGRAVATNDGGATWTTLGSFSAGSPSFSTGSVSFSSATTGLVQSDYEVWATRDGGATWSAAWRPAVWLGAARLVDGLHGWAVGSKAVESGREGVLFETTDGGLTWAQRTLPAGTPPLNAIHFQTPRLGWIVGNGGTILMTKDGGATWARQDPGATTHDFTAVYFDSTKTGWVGGLRGELMATGTGGY